jgi:drug/metabolite transporter (DMT)-like permease
MDVFLLAGLAGLLFGAFTVAVRAALRHRRDPEAGSVSTAVIGFLVAAACLPFADLEGASFAALWPFALAGAIVPGLSQIVFVRAVRDAGASRTAVVVGTAPLLSSALAILLLDEALRPALAVATLAVVLGGVLLAWERTRPPEFRVLGIVLAFAAAALFATRDNVVRWASLDSGADPFLATLVSLGAASIALCVYLAAVPPRHPLARARAALVPFLPAGLCLGLAYTVLLAALERGEVTVVAPLNATQSLWAVVLSATFFRRAEAVGPRLVAAACLVVAGSALVGATR